MPIFCIILLPLLNLHLRYLLTVSQGQIQDLGALSVRNSLSSVHLVQEGEVAESNDCETSQKGEEDKICGKTVVVVWCIL